MNGNACQSLFLQCLRQLLFLDAEKNIQQKTNVCNVNNVRRSSVHTLTNLTHLRVVYTTRQTVAVLVLFNQEKCWSNRDQQNATVNWIRIILKLTFASESGKQSTGQIDIRNIERSAESLLSNVHLLGW